MKKIILSLFALTLLTSTTYAALFKATQLKGLPMCSDSKLLEMTKSNINDFQPSRENESIVEKRNKKILMRDISGFKQVGVQSIDSKNFNRVANALVSAKINMGLIDDDIRICRSASVGPSNGLHLIIYRQNYVTTVEIVNFPGTSKEITFKYD